MFDCEGVLTRVRDLEIENLIGIPLYHLGTNFEFSELTALTKNPNTAAVIAPTLARDIANNGLYRMQPEAITRCIGKVKSELRHAELPYHNYQHSVDLYKRLLLVKKFAKPEIYSSIDWNLLTLAVWSHDLAHSGSPYRQLQHNAHAPSLSNEEYTCLYVDNLLLTDLGTVERLALQGLILATSFGQKHTQAPTKALTRRYRPYSQAEHILSLIDIGAAPFEGFNQWVEDAIRLGHELGHNSPEAIKTFICSPNHENFFDLTGSRLECVVNVLSKHRFIQLSERLKACRLEYRNCIEGRPESLRLIRSTISQYLSILPNAIGE